ncbi:hypothetical protein APHAL10511_005780 [Amanita phalloides]|nr:hypothetical protein APHAL10511_005780 [Amanita phalloides]
MITYFCSIGYMYYAKINDPILGPPGVRILLCFRGFAGFFGIFGLYLSLQYLSLSDSIVLTFLTPLCSTAIGCWLLKERLAVREVVAMVVSLVGVVLIARPPFLFGGRGSSENEGDVSGGQRMISVGAALIGVAGVTGEYTLIRAIGKRAHPLHNIAYLSAFCVLSSSVGMVVSRTRVSIPTRWSFAFLLVLVGLFGLFAQMLMTMGFQREAVGRAAMGVYTGIVYALILGKVVFGNVPGPLSIVGTVLILGSAVWVVVMREAMKEPVHEEVEIGLLDRSGE